MTTNQTTTSAPNRTATLEPPADQELLIHRVFRAPRERVFQAWADPQQAKVWWGPRDHPLTHLEMDPRPGGAWRARLTSTETGQELWQHGVIREVQAPERLVYTFAWDQNPGDSGGDAPPETLVTVTFEDDPHGTRMTFRQAPLDSPESREGHRGGWTSSFDRLDDYLAND